MRSEEKMGQQFGISKEHGRDKKKKYHPVLIFLILTYGKTSKMPNEKNNFWTILFLKTNYIACSNEKIGRNGLIKKKCS